MNLLDNAGSVLGGAAASSPLAALGRAAGAAPAVAGAASAAASALARDSGMAENLSVSSSVNALAQAAAAQSSTGTASGSSDDPLVDLPPLPQLPTPQKAPSVPTDDHGQSNIVFADSGGDGALIH